MTATPASAASRALAGLLVLGVMLCAVLANRARYGVDTTDEAFYYSVPYRFILGDTPFLDEIDPHQSATFFSVPFVAVFRALTGGLEGVVLYMRFVYLTIAGLAALAAFRTLRAVGDLTHPTAAFISLLCLFYLPSGLPALYWDNLATLSLTISLLLLFPYPDRNRRRLVLAGMIVGIGIVAYPPLLPIVVPIVMLVSLKKQTRDWEAFLLFLGGCGSVLLLLLAYVLLLGLPAVSHNLSHALGGPHLGGWVKIAQILRGFGESFPFPVVSCTYLAISAALFRFLGKRVPALVFLVLPLPLLPLLTNDFSAWWGLMRYVVYFGLLGPYLLLFTPAEDALPRRIVLHVWVPSFAAGMLTAWSSANGYMNFSVGFFPAALATAWILARILAASPVPERFRRASLLVPLSLIALFLVFHHSYVYGDGRLSALTATVKSGPFRGLRTQPGKVAYLSTLEKSIERHRREGRILFYDFLPAGYLMSGCRPASNTVWQHPPGLFNASRAPIMEYWRDPDHLPAVVFRTKKVPDFMGGWMSLTYASGDPLDEWIRARYTTQEENEWYTVLTR